MEENTRRLVALFQQADVGWVFDGDAEQRARQILREMHEVDLLFHSRFNLPLDPPLAQAVFSDFTKLKPLVQAFASPMTVEIRTMIFCILDGAQVSAIDFGYRFKSEFHLTVEVEYSTGAGTTFQSSDAWDFEALRHFGIMKLGEKPVLDGYYAFRKAVS